MEQKKKCDCIDKITFTLFKDITDTDDNLVWQLKNIYSLTFPSGIYATSTYLFDKKKFQARFPMWGVQEVADH